MKNIFLIMLLVIYTLINPKYKIFSRIEIIEIMYSKVLNFKLE